MYAAFLFRKNSLNLDSGRTCSTVLTFEGLFGDNGVMASTRESFKVQESESLSAWISCVSGSDEELPHMVPEQIAEVVVIVVVVFGGVVGVAVVVGVALRMV